MVYRWAYGGPVMPSLHAKVYSTYLDMTVVTENRKFVGSLSPYLCEDDGTNSIWYCPKWAESELAVWEGRVIGYVT